MKNYDIVALGELLIDFTQNGLSEQGNPVLEANPGGAPCNLLAMLSKLGHKTAFIGKVGDDGFGRQLENAITEVGIDSKGLRKDKEIHTTLAIVTTSEGGERDFSFYRNPGADVNLSADELDEELIKDAKIFHHGTLSMTADPARDATYKAIEIAKQSGAIVSFDPNLREPLWNSLDDAKAETAYGLERCDILKISDNEILWFTGKDDYDEAVADLRKAYPNIKLLLLSLGRDGSRAFSGDSSVFVPAFRLENTIETTGAGDTFFGSVLHFVLESGLRDYTEAELTEMLTFANAAAALVTTKKGALRVMPNKSEVLSLIESR